MIRRHVAVGLALDEVEAFLLMEDEVVRDGPDRADTLLGISDAYGEERGLAEEEEDIRVVLALLEEDQLDVPRLRLDDTAHLAARIANDDVAAAAADAAYRIAVQNLLDELTPFVGDPMLVEVPRQLVGSEGPFRGRRGC